MHKLTVGVERHRREGLWCVQNPRYLDERGMPQ